MPRKTLPKSAKKLPTVAEEARHTSVLLETIHKEIQVIAEGQNSLRSELDTVKSAVLDVSSDVERMKPIVHSLAPVPDELESLGDVLRKTAKDVGALTYSTAKANQELETVKTELRLVRSDLKTIDERLSTAENKLV